MAYGFTIRTTRGTGMGKRALPFLAALIVLIAVQQAAIAAPAPTPDPNPYNSILVDDIPNLKKLAAPDWLLPGYRLFYDVYYYDTEDKVVDMELLVFDVKGRGDGYVLTSSTTAAFDEEGKPTSLKEDGHVIDFSGIGEAWISPFALSDASAPAVASGRFHLGIFENMVQFDEDGRAWVVTVDVKDTDKGSTTVDIYFDRKNGLALLFDIYVYGALGDFVGGAAVQYKDYAVYEAPWIGHGFSAIKEGAVLEYDIRLEHTDGKVELGVASFTVQENHGGWMKVLEERFFKGVKAYEKTHITSEFSVDGLMFALPGGTIEGLQDGLTYFFDGYTSAKVTAKGHVKLLGRGDAYEILFEDGMAQASSIFRAQDGLMVRYIKSASPSEPYVTTLVYNGTK